MTGKTKEELIALADIALAMCKKEMETGATSPQPVFVLRRLDGSLFQLPLPPHMNMNSGSYKGLLFSLVRVMIDRGGYDASVFATEAWKGKTNEKFKLLMESNPERARRLMHKYNLYGMERLGLATKCECIMVTAQTAEILIYVNQGFVRDEDGKVVLWLEKDIEEFPQEDFHGWQKMFGPLDPSKGDIENPEQVVLEHLERLAKL